MVGMHRVMRSINVSARCARSVKLKIKHYFYASSVVLDHYVVVIILSALSFGVMCITHYLADGQ